MTLKVNLSSKSESIFREETRALIDAYLTELNSDNLHSLRYKNSFKVSAKNSDPVLILSVLFQIQAV